MKTVVVASLRSSAGKTSFIIGLAEALGKNVGYMKPFGDRLLYSKKRLWDYDAALIANIYAMKELPDDMSIGFDHSKLRYMYDENSIRERLSGLADNMGAGKDILLVEGGKSVSYGTSVHLDSLSLCRDLEARLVLVAAGDDNTVLDDLVFLKKSIDCSGIELGGIILNRVRNIEDFTETSLPEIERLGIPVLGIIPNLPELSYFSLSFLADRLFAKILTAEHNLHRTVKNIFIGAMSGNVALQKPLFKKEDKLIITGGDRSDMILAALESDSSGVILTNNILPPANILSKAEQSGTPLLLVTPDTFQVAAQIDRMEPLMTKEDSDKISLLKETVRQTIDLAAFKAG